MSEEFTFDELNLWNWNHSVSIKSIKNPNFTMSDVSKQDLQIEDPIFEGKDQLWNLEEFNKKAQKKLKNRTNVKNFRERKKLEESKMQKKIELLEAENYNLRNQKYCKHCKKRLGDMIQISQTTQEKEKQLRLEVEKEVLTGEGRECFEFEQPKFCTKVEGEERENRNGKIWIALGILFLVLGVHLYGFRGKEGYNDISISSIESRKIVDMYEGRSDNLDDYFNVKVKYNSKTNSKSEEIQESKEGIFKQIRIYNGEENNESIDKTYETTIKRTIDKLDMIEERNENNYRKEKKEGEYEHEVKFHKDFLYAIQAEIDDVGQYI